jgi:hypothetical protein
MGYDDYKTTPPDMPSGSGNGRSSQPYRCDYCARSFDATGAVQHHQATGHVIVGRRGVVQEFSVTPAKAQAAA